MENVETPNGIPEEADRRLALALADVADSLAALIRVLPPEVPS